MIIVRDIFQVKFGHMDSVLAIFREGMETRVTSDMSATLMTDISGDMFKLVIESKAESVDAHRARMLQSFQDPDASSWMGRVMEHVEHGRREYYNIEMEI